MSQQADQVLQKLYKRRSTPACYPCYKRKVRCQGGRPCQTCIERGHTDICHDDEAPRKRPKKATMELSTGNERLPPNAPNSTLEILPGNANASVRPGLHDGPSRTGEFSAVQYVRRRLDDAHGLLHDDLTPDTTTPYHCAPHQRPVAIVPLHLRQRHRLADILPRPHEIFRFFPPFRDLIMPLYPIVTDLAALESSIYHLTDRIMRTNIDQHDVDIDGEEVSEVQVAVILACLALGCQFAELDAAGRQEASQNFVSRSNTCLQEGNCILQPSVEVVQALLLIGLAQQNLEQSDGAWIQLGLTHRIAQNLGLDKPQAPSGDGVPGRKAHPLWQAILWQDGMLSFRYDRQLLQYDIDRGDNESEFNSTESDLSYLDAMNSICSTTVQLLQKPKVRLDDYGRRTQLLRRVEDICSRCCAHLRPGNMPRTFQQRSEHLLLKLHASFLAAEICRPGFTNPPADDSQLMFREKGVGYLQQCLLAFLDLCRFSRLPLRSWSITQAALSTALLLAMLAPQLQSEDVPALLLKVSDVLNTDTAPPLAPSEIRGPCVGLSMTRMKASELLAYVVDQSSKNESLSLVRNDAPVAPADMREVWAATQDLGDWPTEFSLFDPNFTANMLDFELGQG